MEGIFYGSRYTGWHTSLVFHVYGYGRRESSFVHIGITNIGSCSFQATFFKARIGKARELLKQDELNISEVGVRVGYEAAHSITRFFKKMTGLTPLEHRDALRAKK
ncbi:helix-turn-helix transcriptional regulator [Paenibacillus frigoriresistens]|uniref:helix-turn-helix domain-containing protein n=1 Tax=Paenibacillus alginolyticus TaxID=59839 RepID=UPI001564F291|nr:helix-turn-helix transcriptional regulator [Paenibacillus frigoriresistens]